MTDFELNRISSVIIAFVLLSFNAVGQSKPILNGSPKKNSINKADLVQKLDSYFSAYNKNTPGIAITVVENGKVLAKKSYGMASLELTVPFSHDTRVRIGYSEGREFISIAVALMERDGLLNLNDRVQKFFPNLPAWSSNVSIQDLLNHSSGFADEWSMLTLMHNSMANRFETTQFLKLLYNQPLPEIEPGKGYMYSNSDFGLLRLIMEKASSQDLSQYMENNIFDPLGMSSTLLHNDKEELIVNRAFSYTTEWDVTEKYKLWLRDKTSPGGNYAIITSANDLEQWAKAHSDPTSFVSKAIIRLKQKARPIPVLPNVNYVFGYKLLEIENHPIIMHMGVNNHSYLIEVPSKALSIICITNKFQPYLNEVMPLLNFLLDVKENKNANPDMTLPEKYFAGNKNVQQFAGIYKWQDDLTFQSEVRPKRFSEFIVKGDSLLWLLSSKDTVYMMPVSNGVFKDEGYPVWISFHQQHPDSAMKASLYNGSVNKTFSLNKLPNSKRIINKEQLAKLEGKYYSKHLDYYLTLRLNEANKLVVQRPTLPDKFLEPGYEGDYMLEIESQHDNSWTSWVKFFYDDSGKVSHFTISYIRLMGHRFDKVEQN